MQSFAQCLYCWGCACLLWLLVSNVCLLLKVPWELCTAYRLQVRLECVLLVEFKGGVHAQHALTQVSRMRSSSCSVVVFDGGLLNAALQSFNNAACAHCLQGSALAVQGIPRNGMNLLIEYTLAQHAWPIIATCYRSCTLMAPHLMSDS